MSCGSKRYRLCGGLYDGKVYALDATTGTKNSGKYSAQSHNAVNWISSSPAVANGVVYIGGGEGNTQTVCNRKPDSRPGTRCSIHNECSNNRYCTLNGTFTDKSAEGSYLMELDVSVMGGSRILHNRNPVHTYAVPAPLRFH